MEVQQLEDGGYMYRMIVSFTVFIGIMVIGAFMWPRPCPQNHYDSPLLKPRVVVPVTPIQEDEPVKEEKDETEPMIVEPSLSEEINPVVQEEEEERVQAVETQ